MPFVTGRHPIRNLRRPMAFSMPMPRTVTRLFLATLALAAVLAPAAHASTSQTMTFEAPRDLLNPSTRPKALDEIGSLGARSLRVILYWKSVAPSPNARRKPGVDLSDPASYAWGEYDATLAAAKERGWPVILTVSGPVPRWATKRKRDDVTNPSAKEFQAFVTAVGRKYGEQIGTWSVWNEPNHPDFLKPQYDKRHNPASGKVYRGLFLAAWRGLRASGNGRDAILMGETAPVGTGKVVAPLTFLRQTLCLDRAYRKRQRCSNLPADGYAHHAYTTRLGPFYVPDSPNAVTIGVIGRLVNALDRAARAGAIERRMGIYLTEFGIQSYPDKLAGVPLAQQPEYYAISERIAYENPRVKAFSQYLMRDDDRARGGLNGGSFPGFESGLEFANGKRKPAYAGYRLPLTVTKRGGRVGIWGKVRPATGATTAELEFQDRGGSWRRLKTVRTDARGYFTASSANRKGRRWRVRWASAEGTRFTGPPIRAYAKP
jgi:hypothetical protein